MTLYRFSLSSLLVALVAFQHTYASINLDENQILKIVIEEYCNTIPCKTEQRKAKKEIGAKIKTAIAAKASDAILTPNIAFASSSHFESPTTFNFPNFPTYLWKIADYNPIPSPTVLAAHSSLSLDTRASLAQKNLQLRI